MGDRKGECGGGGVDETGRPMWAACLDGLGEGWRGLLYGEFDGGGLREGPSGGGDYYACDAGGGTGFGGGIAGAAGDDSDGGGEDAEESKQAEGGVATA